MPTLTSIFDTIAVVVAVEFIDVDFSHVFGVFCFVDLCPGWTKRGFSCAVRSGVLLGPQQFDPQSRMTAVMCGPASNSTTTVAVSQQQQDTLLSSSQSQASIQGQPGLPTPVATPTSPVDQQQHQQIQSQHPQQQQQLPTKANAQLQQRVAALQQSVGNLAQLDLQGLAALLPPGTSIEQLQNIKQKLVQLNQIQQQQAQHRKLERSASEPHPHTDIKDMPESALSSVNSSRYKTELCRPFEENGTCKYGDKCQFAHGLEELRSLARHPKYKTELCRTFHTTGLCPYGPRCHFIHNADEAKRIAASSATSPGSASLSGVSSASSQEALNMKMLGNPPTHGGNAGFEPYAQQQQQQQLTQQHKIYSQYGLMRGGQHAATRQPQQAAHQQDILSQMQHHPSAAMMKSRMHALRPKALSIGCMSLGSAGELSPPVSPSMHDDPFTPSYLNASTRHGGGNFFTASSSPSSSSASPSVSSGDVSMLYPSPSPPSLSTSPLAAGVTINAGMAMSGSHPTSATCPSGLLTPSPTMSSPTSSCGSAYGGSHLPLSMSSTCTPLSFSSTFGDQLMSAPAVISSSPIFEFPSVNNATSGGGEHRRFRTLTPPSPLESLGADLTDSLVGVDGCFSGQSFAMKKSTIMAIDSAGGCMANISASPISDGGGRCGAMRLRCLVPKGALLSAAADAIDQEVLLKRERDIVGTHVQTQQQTEVGIHHCQGLTTYGGKGRAEKSLASDAPDAARLEDEETGLNGHRSEIGKVRRKQRRKACEPRPGTGKKTSVLENVLAGAFCPWATQ
ncbi:hypothetical protein BIW11_12729 [Tropilaelaps mercedesae]|uniref:C3H1-type domain-containing protein n=1 Tax=Tropilaelaps mercedesae TaxID=418985 RepID=A0A1V9X5N7_9ACAR|nr:hypothetical protein BIW11_12729 [Tropilaelaps mercedesae]